MYASILCYSNSTSLPQEKLAPKIKKKLKPSNPANWEISEIVVDTR